MKKFVLLTVAFSAVTLLCSCGSLNQHVGGEQLTPANIDFAKHIIHEPDWSEMVIDIDGVDEVTDKWNSDFVPAFPVLYWTTLGSYKEDKYFGVRKVATVFPAFYVRRDSLYTADGKRRDKEFEFNMLYALWYESRQKPNNKGWKCGLLYLPGLGPFLGFGSGFFQFLWIPFSDMD